MDYASITVHINASRHTPNRVKFASELAKACDAHLIGLVTSGVAEAFNASGLTGEGTALIGTYLDFCKRRAETNLAAFEETAAGIGVRSFEKRLSDEETGYALCMQARYSDLLVIGQADPEEEDLPERADIPEYVLMHSGRPVLLLPYTGEFRAVGKHALFAWNGSLESSRAIFGAIPLLKRCAKTEIVIFNPEAGSREHGEEPGVDMAAYLARHGLNVQVSRKATGHQTDIGNALLSYATDVGADLLVMGGYGHSRIRELVLGGVTRTIFRSMTLPVLMSH
jgi:nucleotide-binding universal stress UspA family protein